MEGIRDVGEYENENATLSVCFIDTRRMFLVEETGAHTDDETESPLSVVNNESPLWTIADVTEHVGDHEKPPAVTERSVNEKEKTDIPQTTKKKKILKTRKSSVYICTQRLRL